jgi:hypothetical protein
MEAYACRRRTLWEYASKGQKKLLDFKLSFGTDTNVPENENVLLCIGLHFAAKWRLQVFLLVG